VHYSFNPCFVGLVFQTIANIVQVVRHGCFNPCFVGLVFQTILSRSQAHLSSVSILVLLD